MFVIIFSKPLVQSLVNDMHWKPRLDIQSLFAYVLLRIIFNYSWCYSEPEWRCHSVTIIVESKHHYNPSSNSLLWLYLGQYRSNFRTWTKA